MAQPFLVKLSVCAAIASSLLLSSCAKQQPDGRALFERVRPLSDAILADPQRASSVQVAQAIGALEAVIQQVPGRYGAGLAEEALGRVYLALGEPAKARGYFTHIVWYYHQYSDMGVMALIYIGRTYEAEQNWEAAEKAYKAIDDQYQWSPLWLGAPLFVGEMYDRHGDRQRAAEAYQRAVSLLQYRAERAPSPEVEAKIKMELATAHERLGQWAQAAAVLEPLESSSEAEVDRAAVLMRLGELYAVPGRDAAKARAALTRLVQEFPAHPRAGEARTQLERLASSLSPGSASEPHR